jgi:protein-disulfide isomerase
LRGDPNALVTIVEWLSYEEPYSRQAEPTMLELEAGEYGPLIRRIVRQRPFQFEHAEMLARASIAAYDQDRFWELHDAFFAYPDVLDETALDELALAAGIDLEQMHEDMQSDTTTARLAEDEVLLDELTDDAAFVPAFWVNGRRVTGAQHITFFQGIIDEEAAAMQALLDAGLTPCEAYAERLAANLE